MSRSGWLAVLVLGSGCVTVEGSFVPEGKRSAAFDLQCSQENLEVVVLERKDGLSCDGSRIGITGCGKQVTYACEGSTWKRSSKVERAGN
ncbi:MAG: hypothetical protein K1X89_20065 [Myxococcaceae bacterium]|nr:hypothetical protein [Myxococcaceae bacterium]